MLEFHGSGYWVGMNFSSCEQNSWQVTQADTYFPPPCSHSPWTTLLTSATLTCPVVHICFGQWHASKYNSNSHLQQFPSAPASLAGLGRHWNVTGRGQHLTCTTLARGQQCLKWHLGQKRQNIHRDFFLRFDNCVVSRLISARRCLQIGFDASMDEFWQPDSGVQRAEEIKSPPIFIHSDFHCPLGI